MISSDKCEDLTVLIVNYNSDGDLTRCLSCVKLQTIRPSRVVIVDNASTDTSLLQAKSRFPEYEFIELDSNLGFAAANNLILKTLKTDYVATLSPDAFADTEWLENLRAALRYSGFDSFASCQLMDLDEFRLDGAGDVYKIYGLYKGDTTVGIVKFLTPDPTLRRFFRLRGRSALSHGCSKGG